MNSLSGRKKISKVNKSVSPSFSKLVAKYIKEVSKKNDKIL